MSHHTNRSIDLAASKGAWSSTPAARPLWKLSKRELVEIALHFAALATESYDDSLQNGDAAARAMAERDALKRAGIL